MEEILKAIQAQNQAMQAQTQALQAQNQETREALQAQTQALQAQNQETREALNEALQAQNKELKESLGLEFQCLEDEISAVKEDVSSVKEEMASLKERLAAVETGHRRTPVFQQENNNSGRPLVKVPTFDGQSSWTSFKTQFDVDAQANGWNVRDKASFLAAALRGPAVDVLQMIPEQLRLDFNSLIDTLYFRYGEEHYQQLHVVKFKNILQEKKESLQDLANDIRRLARLAFPSCPSETQDFMAQQQFIDAIGDPETQKFARLSTATTLQETLVQAMKHEAAQQASRGSYRMARQVKMENPERGKGRCWTCGANDHLSPTCPRRVKQRSDTGCWKCGKYGHIRKNCQDNSMDKPEIKRGRCWNCGAHDHISPTCPRKLKQRGDTDCWSCGQNGHLRRNCPENSEITTVPRKNHGRRNDNADALSRRSCVPQSGHCARAEERFCVRQVTVQESDEVEEKNWTGQALRKAQREDRDLLPMINWKESDERPSWEDVAPYSPKTKSLWSLWNSLTLRDGVLYRKWESEDGKHESWKLGLPRSHVPLALQEMHSSTTGDHFGIRKTLAKAREIFCWPGSRNDVEKWCRNCTQCSVRKGPKTRSRRKLKIYNVGAPFERMPAIHQWAGENLHFSSEKMKERYNVKTSNKIFKEGEMVWLHNSQRKKRLYPKLQYQWEGPYKIIKCLNDVIYRIQKTPTSKPKVVHYNRLAPFRGTVPVQWTVRDDQSTPGYIGRRNSCKRGRRKIKGSRRTKLRGVLQASCCLKRSDCCLPPTPVYFLEDSRRFYELLSPVLLLLSSPCCSWMVETRSGKMQDPAQERIKAEESAKPQPGATIGRDASSDPVVLNPNIDIPKYDGTEDPRPWIESLEEIGFLYHWADYIISRYAAMNMIGSAKTWLNLHKVSFTSWENFKSRLIEDFASDANKEEMRMRLNRIQQWNEPAIRFAEDILVLCNKVDPQMEEETKINWVIGGLKKEYSFALHLNPPKNTNELLEICKKLDLFEKNYQERAEKSKALYNGPRSPRPHHQEQWKNATSFRRPYQNTSKPQAPAPRYYQNTSKPQAPTPRYYQNKPLPQVSAPRRSYTPNPEPKPVYPSKTYNKNPNSNRNRTEDGRPICFKCNKPGHVTRYCRVKFVRIVEEDPIVTQDKVEEEIRMDNGTQKSRPLLYSDSVNQSKSTINGIKKLDPKYKMNINVDRIGICEALIDTGADLSVVDLSTALNTGLEIINPDKMCSGPDGKELDIVGNIILNIKFDDKTITHQFVIMRTHLRIFILGRDFLKKMNAKIDCQREIIKYDLTENRDVIKYQQKKIKSAKDAIIPELSIKLINAFVEAEDGEYIIEENHKMFQTNGLRLARSLINVVNKETYIWITNPYPRPLKILKNQTLCFGSQPAEVNLMEESEQKEHEEPQFQINENLAYTEKEQLKQVLERYEDLFSSGLGRSNLAKHRIDTEGAKPIKHKPYRVSAKEREIIKEQIDEMLRDGIIRPSSSPWSFPVILVKKRDVLDTLQGSKYFSAIDLKSGYWQVEVEEKDKEKTAFTTAHGLYEFNVMPFGLCNAPATFERNMENMLDEKDDFIENIKENLSGNKRSITQNFKEENGCLYKKNPNPEGRAWLLVVPKKRRKEVMSEYHNHMLNGHLGVARTTYRLKNKYYWPSMLKDASEFVKTCHLCQSRKGSNHLPSGLLQPIPPANYPFERIGIDFVGPLPSTKRRRKWIIVLTDYYTKYAETKAVSEATVKEVSTFLIEHIILRHGAPRFLISDRGSQFTSNLMKEVMKMCKVKHCFTTSYHPQTNGLTERLNRTLINMISMYVNTDQKNWDEILPFITHAYNTTIQETTGYSPFFLLFGREPMSLLDDENIPTDSNMDDYDEYIENYLDKIARTRQVVINNTEKTQERMKRNYDKKHNEKIYEPGHLVAVWTPVRKIGKCEKLLRKYFGPYRILKKLSNVNYLIEPKDNPGQDPLIVQVSRLKPYFERIDEVTHEDVTTSGEGEVLHHD
ncbi:hypothetical protein LAZ67_14002092 [Cordylochernes scorpioides]|uniref:RNA-directed DNA polymerase n=1 Tax=Cordylochernes scorpioides TaxID=51811 RepID=A0ABY6LBJ0_9ARAC|nr:hypothetical protein LAZ67_14002092 [Cordylochernes scorpioides]